MLPPLLEHGELRRLCSTMEQVEPRKILRRADRAELAGLRGAHAMRCEGAATVDPPLPQAGTLVGRSARTPRLEKLGVSVLN
jgi:hypothetical protein